MKGSAEIIWDLIDPYSLHLVIERTVMLYILSFFFLLFLKHKPPHRTIGSSTVGYSTIHLTTGYHMPNKNRLKAAMVVLRWRGSRLLVAAETDRHAAAYEQA